MTFFTAFAIYFIIWWLTLFVVLPIGVKSQAENNEVTLGTEPGAPTNARIGAKLALNCLVAGIVFGIYWFVSSWFDIGLSDIPHIIPDQSFN